MTELQQLEAQAAEMLALTRQYLERGWTTVTAARDEKGERTDPYGPAATCWCLEGAIRVAAARLSTPGQALFIARMTLQRRIDRELSVLNYYLIPDWNDAPGRTKEEVLALVTWGIEQLRGTA